MVAYVVILCDASPITLISAGLASLHTVAKTYSNERLACERMYKQTNGQMVYKDRILNGQSRTSNNDQRKMARNLLITDSTPNVCPCPSLRTTWRK